MEDFSLWLMRRLLIHGSVWVLESILPTSLWWFFPQPWIVFPYGWTDQLSDEWILGVGGPSEETQLSLSAALSSPVFCPVNSTHHGLFELPTLSSQLRETAGLLLGSLSQSCSLKLSMQWTWAIIKLSSLLFSAWNRYFLYIPHQFFGCLNN